MNEEPYIRVEVVHDDGTRAVYHVRELSISEAVQITSADDTLTIRVDPRRIKTPT